MIRTALFPLLVTARIASAGGDDHKLELALQGAASEQVFARMDGFPAVSADGRTLAHLFMDSWEFSGEPLTTLVMWSTATGVVTASFSISGITNGKTDPKSVLARANAALAKTTWRAATTYTPTDPDPKTNAAQTLSAAGVRFELDPKKGDLVFGKRRASFDPPHRIVKVEHGCASTPIGIDSAFGAGKLVVVVPVGGMLGGDSCMAMPSVDRAVAIRLP